MELNMTTEIKDQKYWQQHSEKLKASRLSRSKYCRENNLDYDRFGYWLRKSSTATPKFIPVQVQAPTTQSALPSTALCTVELGGHVLKIHDLTALSFLIEKLI
jgi:hypothetical protein